MLLWWFDHFKESATDGVYVPVFLNDSAYPTLQLSFLLQPAGGTDLEAGHEGLERQFPEAQIGLTHKLYRKNRSQTCSSAPTYSWPPFLA